MRTSWKQAIIVAVVIVVLLTSCTGPEQRGNDGSAEMDHNTMRDPYARYYQSQPQRPFHESIPRMLNNKDGHAVIRLISSGDELYVPMQEFTQLLGFNTEWETPGEVYFIGDNDPVFELRMNSTEAVREEESVHLPAAPIALNGAVHMPLSAFGVLFQNEADFEVAGSQLLLRPGNHDASFLKDDEDAAIGEVDETLNFAEDPTDPLKDVEVWLPAQNFEPDPLPVLSGAKANALIREARRYLGVPYKFGAKPYPTSKRFDCSTYTQYLFKRQGIQLRRTARAQARQGVHVSRKNLRKGDLMFFYVPGRFKKEKTIGHVGIYIGNQKMIHSSPKPKDGVQITSINKPYWKKTFIRARRFN